MIDRGWIINSGLEHLLLASGSTGTRSVVRNVDRPGVINVHKSSSFPDGPVREDIAVDHWYWQSAPLHLPFDRFRSREEKKKRKEKRERDAST